MKFVIVALLLLSLALAVTPTKGTEIVKQLQGIDLDGEIFVILFFDPTCCRAPDSTINDDVRKGLKDKVFNTDHGKKYISYEVDTSDQDMVPVLELLHIDEHQTKHGPTVLIAAEGTGFWAHGKNSADKIAKKVPQFDNIKEESLKKIKARDTLIN